MSRNAKKKVVSVIKRENLSNIRDPKRRAANESPKFIQESSNTTFTNN